MASNGSSSREEIPRPAIGREREDEERRIYCSIQLVFKEAVHRVLRDPRSYFVDEEMERKMETIDSETRSEIRRVAQSKAQHYGQQVLQSFRDHITEQMNATFLKVIEERVNNLAVRKISDWLKEQRKREKARDEAFEETVSTKVDEEVEQRLLEVDVIQKYVETQLEKLMKKMNAKLEVEKAEMKKKEKENAAKKRKEESEKKAYKNLRLQYDQAQNALNLAGIDLTQKRRSKEEAPNRHWKSINLTKTSWGKDIKKLEEKLKEISQSGDARKEEEEDIRKQLANTKKTLDVLIAVSSKMNREDLEKKELMVKQAEDVLSRAQTKRDQCYADVAFHSETEKLNFSRECPVCLRSPLKRVAIGCGHILCDLCYKKLETRRDVVPPLVQGGKAYRECPTCRFKASYCIPLFEAEVQPPPVPRQANKRAISDLDLEVLDVVKMYRYR